MTVNGNVPSSTTAVAVTLSQAARILITGFTFVVASACSVSVKIGSTTVLGPFPVGDNGGIVLPEHLRGWADANGTTISIVSDAAPGSGGYTITYETR